MDGLIAPNAPMPPPPTPASGISEILFDIGGALSADPRNQRTDLALIFYQLAANLRPEHDFAWLMIAGLYEQFQMVPKAVAALGKIGVTSPLYWQARLRVAALDAQQEKFEQAGALRDREPLFDRRRRYLQQFSTEISVRIHFAISASACRGRYWPVYFAAASAGARKPWPKAEAREEGARARPSSRMC